MSNHSDSIKATAKQIMSARKWISSVVRRLLTTEIKTTPHPNRQTSQYIMDRITLAAKAIMSAMQSDAFNEEACVKILRDAQRAPRTASVQLNDTLD
jgi:hypothetical protein